MAVFLSVQDYRHGDVYRIIRVDHRFFLFFKADFLKDMAIKSSNYVILSKYILFFLPYLNQFELVKNKYLYQKFCVRGVR